MTNIERPTTTPERIDLARADDLRDVVHRAVSCLAQGGLVGLPTETTYTMAAIATRPEVAERLRLLCSDEPEDSIALGINSPVAAADWVPGLSTLGQRLVQRAWPGPVTLVFHGLIKHGLASRLPESVRSLVASETTINLRLPSHDVVREILRRTVGPLVLASPSRALTEVPLHDPESLAQLVGLDMLLDDGLGQPDASTTVVAVEGDSWRVVRPGPVPEADLMRMAGMVIVFVCTGNTCRSPMAEALCKLKLAKRLGCAPEELESRGYAVISAGLAAGPGSSAAADAMEIVASRGGTLDGHSSQPVTSRLIAQADWIIPMTRDHLDAILGYQPEVASRVRLLDPSGRDIDDPVGRGREVYKQTADAIEAHLEHLLDSLGV